MKVLKQSLFAVFIGAAAVMSMPVHAQSQASGQSQSAEMSEGEVRKVDKENRKITLRHGPIKNLDMPAMTMVFGVAEPAVLDKVKPGDKVRFRASNEAGKLTVAELVPVS